MSIDLPRDLENRIRAQISSGQFDSEQDVVREALDTLEKRQRGLGELRQMVREADEDVAAGRVGQFDAEETKRAVRERLDEHGVTDW
jgi:putative addiction module CopG family antidote